MDATECRGTDLYECKVCLEDMTNKNSRFLHCHHSFCESCLENLFTNKQIKCPVCRNVTYVIRGTVQNLPINFYLTGMKEREKELVCNMATRCGLCRSKIGISQCHECDVIICGNCTDQHQTVDMFTDHTLVPLCSKHKLCLRYVCLSCEKNLCVKCVTLSHATNSCRIVTYNEESKMDEVQNVPDSLTIKSEADKELTETTGHTYPPVTVPRLVLNLSRERQNFIRSPFQLCIGPANTIFVADLCLQHIVQLDHAGEMIQVFDPKKYVNSNDTPDGCNEPHFIADISYKDGFLYVAQLWNILKINISVPDDIKMYVPKMGVIRRFLVISPASIIISEAGNPGNIYEYKPLCNTLRIVVSSLNNPADICLSKKDGQNMFIVNEQGTHLVRVYNEDWKLQGKFGGRGTSDGYLNYAHSIISKPNGTIFIADDFNNRVCEFSLDGAFIRHVLPNDIGVFRPWGLALIGHCLYVTECDESHGAVKCFQISGTYTSNED